MECKFCRNEVPEGAKVCPVCGTPVEPETSGAEQANQEQTGGYTYGVPNQEQTGGYNYGAPNQEQTGGYSYGAPNQEQQAGGYSYGAPNQEQQTGGYSYGAPNQEQQTGGYSYGTPNQEQQAGGYNYGTPNQGQPAGGYSYGAPNQGNYGQPVKQISGTPYMVFAIITTLLCCLPLGIAAIVFASKINSCQRNGDYAGAQAAAKKAKLFTIIGVVGGLILNIIFIAIGVKGFKDEGVLKTPSSVSSDYEEDEDDDTADIADADDADEEKPAAKPAQASGDLGAAWDTYTVQLNDKVVTLPCTMEEIEAVGLSLDTDYTPEDYVINSDEYALIYFEDAAGNEIRVEAVNTSDEAKTVKECLVGSIFVDKYGIEEGGLTVLFPGGLQIGASKEDMLALYGETDDVYEGDSIHMYTWSAEGTYYSSCEIDLDAETGLVYSMEMSNYGE